MAKVSTNINIDENLKKDAQMLFADLGMDFTTAVTIYLRQAVREQRIPFEITRSVPNSVTIAALSEYEEMKTDPIKYKRYDSFDSALAEVLDNA